MVRANVVKIFVNGKEVDKANEGENAAIHLDKTTFYAEAGGQIGDRGWLTSEDGQEILFQVEDCQKLGPNVIAHVGQGRVGLGDRVQVRLDTEHRIKCMQNHTGTHLLNAALHSLLPLTGQKSSLVGADWFKFDFSCFDQKVDLDFVREVEKIVAELIDAEAEIKTEEMSFSDIEQNEEVILIPGEQYPDRVTVIKCGDFSTEPCCGTHLRNSADVQDFVVVQVTSDGFGAKSFKCKTGQNAFDCRERGKKLIEELKAIQEKVDLVGEETGNADLQNLLLKLQTGFDSKQDYPYEVLECRKEILSGLLAKLKSLSRADTKDVFRDEMKEVLRESKNHNILHFLDFPNQSQARLSKVMTICPTEEKSILLLARTKEGLTGQSCVPRRHVTKEFNAENWMKKVTENLGGKIHIPLEQDGNFICNFNLHSVEDSIVQKIPEAILAGEKMFEDAHGKSLQLSEESANQLKENLQSKGFKADVVKIAPFYFKIQFSTAALDELDQFGNNVLINVEEIQDGICEAEFLLDEKGEQCLQAGNELKSELERFKLKLSAEEDVEKLKKCVQDKIDILHGFERELTSREKSVFRSDVDYPHKVLQERKSVLNSLQNQINALKRTLTADPFQVDLEKVLSDQKNDSLIAHCFDYPNANRVRLPRLTKMCPEKKAVFLLATTKYGFSGRACLPEEFITEDFNAESWMKEVAKLLHAKMSSPSNQARFVCNLSTNEQISKNDMEAAISLARKTFNNNNSVNK